MTDSTATPVATSTTTPETSSQQAATISTNIESITTSIATALSMVTEPTALKAIEGFFEALPETAQIVLMGINWWNNVTGQNPAAFVAKYGPIFTELFNASTQEERENAAQNISNAIRNLKS